MTTPPSTNTGGGSGAATVGNLTFTVPQSSPQATPPQATPPAKTEHEHGFPPNTPVSQMTPEEKAAYSEHVEARTRERRDALKGAIGDRSLEQVKADLDELESLRDKDRTATEKEIAAAKKAMRAEVEAEYAPRLVKAAFATALAGMKDDERVELLDTINVSAFVNQQGDLDAVKVTNWIKRYAPQSDTGTGEQYGDHGGGKRTPSRVPPGAEGLAEAQRRFGDQPTAPSPLSLERNAK